MIIRQKPFKQRLGQTTGGYSSSLRFIYPVAMVMPRRCEISGGERFRGICRKDMGAISVISAIS